MPNPTPDSYVFTPGVTLYVGQATPGGSLLTTLTLVNTSGSEQAASFVAPMFGQPFVQGDVPSGQYPQFELTDGTPCPATIHSVTTWPDGSMKWCGVLLRVPTTIAGSGSLTINVKNGGSAPSASSRTTGDLTAADLSTVLTGVTNLTGEWTASLNTAITDADDIVSLGDGPAGRIWRIGGPFKQSGSPHGQLHCWHYVAALQNSSGGLLGLRYLGRAAQPWADVSSPTPTRRVLTAALKSGSTTLRSLQGHDTTETPGSNIGMGHYTSFFTAGTDGKWDFVQGGGSASADCTVRVQHDKTYFVKSRQVPPYDLTVEPTSSSSVDYYAYGRGGMARAMQTSGERVDIGVLPSWAARHLLTQAQVDERVIRVVGLSSAGWRTLLRKQSTGQIIPCIDVQSSYTGLGTIEPTWTYTPGGTNVGVQVPSDATSLWSSEFEPSHRPSAAYYPYLVTGEPQFLDLLVEQASGLLLNRIPGGFTRNTTPPITSLISSAVGNRNMTVGATTFKGGGVMFSGGGMRITAWLTRDVAQAASIYPDTCPFGTAAKTYFNDVAEAGYEAMNVFVSQMPQTWRDSGFFMCRANGSNELNLEQPWQDAYFSNSIAHQSAILASTEAATLRQHVGKFWSSITANGDLAQVATSYAAHFDENDELILDADDMLFSIPGVLTFESAGDTFTLSDNPSASNKFGDWNPQNGDVISFTSQLRSYKPFTEAVDRRKLYVVNASGKTGQLALTPGGSVIPVTTEGSLNLFLARLQSAAPEFTFEDGNNYVTNLYAALRHLSALGDTGVAAALAAQESNFTDSGATFTADPKNAFAATYPG